MDASPTVPQHPATFEHFQTIFGKPDQNYMACIAEMFKRESDEFFPSLRLAAKNMSSLSFSFFLSAVFEESNKGTSKKFINRWNRDYRENIYDYGKNSLPLQLLALLDTLTFSTKEERDFAEKRLIMEECRTAASLRKVKETDHKIVFSVMENTPQEFHIPLLEHIPDAFSLLALKARKDLSAMEHLLSHKRWPQKDMLSFFENHLKNVRAQRYGLPSSEENASLRLVAEKINWKAVPSLFRVEIFQHCAPADITPHPSILSGLSDAIVAGTLYLSFSEEAFKYSPEAIRKGLKEVSRSAFQTVLATRYAISGHYHNHKNISFDRENFHKGLLAFFKDSFEHHSVDARFRADLAHSVLEALFSCTPAEIKDHGMGFFEILSDDHKKIVIEALLNHGSGYSLENIKNLADPLPMDFLMCIQPPKNADAEWWNNYKASRTKDFLTERMESVIKTKEKDNVFSKKKRL